jgi:hypothetical protein
MMEESITVIVNMIRIAVVQVGSLSLELLDMVDYGM